MLGFMCLMHVFKYRNTKILLGLLDQMLLKKLNCNSYLTFVRLWVVKRGTDWRSCWNLLFVLNLAKDSTHLFCFMYCRLNTGTIQEGSAGKVDLEADEE